MTSTGQALQLAQQLARAAPARVVAKQPNAVANAVQFQIPESLKDVPHHLFTSVPIEKLIKQRPFFEFPDWCAPPSQTNHPNVHFDVVRPIPPGAEFGNNTGEVQYAKLPPMMLNRFPFYLIGNSEQACDMTMIHPSISRVHLAVVHHQRGIVCICDVNSSNGVFLNDKRIAKGTYVPVAEGDKIRLGASSRILILRLGEQQQQEKKEENKNEVVTNEQQPQEQSSTTIREPERRERQDDQIQQQHQEEKQSASDQQQEETSSSSSPATIIEFPKVHLAHLLIKHKDIEKPKSTAPRNKGEAITRSLEDAIELAKAIRSQLATSPDNGQEISPSQQQQRFILKEKSIFEEAVSKFSECATAKRGGDMGVVEKGSLDNLPEFEATALKLTPLEISSDVVVTHLGVHILFRVPDEEVDQ